MFACQLTDCSDNSYIPSCIDVQISHLTKGAVYSCKLLAMGVLESGATSAENNEEMTKAFLVGKKELNVDETLYRSSTPSAYY